MYWRLSRALAPREIERANRRLAFALGGDLSSRDAGRILWAPGTVNHVRGSAVRLLQVEDRMVSPGDLVGGLEDPPGWQPPRRRPVRAGSRGAVETVTPERCTSKR